MLVRVYRVALITSIMIIEKNVATMRTQVSYDITVTGLRTQEREIWKTPVPPPCSRRMGCVFRMQAYRIHLPTGQQVVHWLFIHKQVQVLPLS